jgi:tagatose 1,6-diphosphate aldolase
VSGDDVVTGRSGVRRGLVATSTAKGHFAIVALDHVASMAATMVPDNPATVTGDQLVDAKAQVTDRLRHSASAVLLDPMDGYSTVHTPAELADGIGLVLGIEASDYMADHVAPHLLEGWSVERAAEAGADAVKISFPFDPRQDTHVVEQFVADVAAQSHRSQLPLFAEPLGVWRSPDERRQVTVAAARRFGDLGVAVLKLEFPIDVAVVDDEATWFEACSELDAASPVPWTVLSGGEPFERFHAMVRVACDAGASGFVAGRALWRECVAGGFVDASAVEQAARRLEQLIALVDDRARPWFGHRSWSVIRDGGET